MKTQLTICFLLVVFAFTLTTTVVNADDYQDVTIGKLSSVPDQFVGKLVRTKAEFGALQDLLGNKKSKCGTSKGMFVFKPGDMGYLAQISFVIVLSPAALDNAYDLKQKQPIIMEGSVYKGVGMVPGQKGFTFCVANIKAEKVSVPATESETSGSDDTMAKLKKLKEMKDAGLISEEEYEAKKKELLSKM